MTFTYEKVVTSRGGLRLHLNENTSGCSPAVIEALRSLSTEDVAYYPDYTTAIASCAEYLGVTAEHVLLTNGLDEGVLGASIAALRGSSLSDPFEAVVVVPAFDMYAACADAACGRVIEVGVSEDFILGVERVLDALSPRTRIVFIADPNNPTGVSVPRQEILQIAAAAPRALVFVDEAYAEFRGSSLIGDPALVPLPNVIVGRTFAKAHGLAALRVGALVGDAHTLADIRRVMPPYSINVAAAVALRAALADRAHLEAYIAESCRSKALLYAALDRLEIEYWRSDANFVLVRFGTEAARIVEGLADRGIHVRDRSSQHGCRGCVRITTGAVAHTERAIEAIREVLCGAP